MASPFIDRYGKDIWGCIIKWLEFDECARLTETGHDLHKIVKDERLGCRRCPGWLKRFAEDQSENHNDIYSIDCWNNGIFALCLEMYCECGAIYSFCKKCLKPSICVGHSGALDGIFASSNTLLPGNGVTRESIARKNQECGDIVFRGESKLKYDTREPNDSECDDDESNDYPRFYVGDLCRHYAVAYEQVDDVIFHFDLTGSDGGDSVRWYCPGCERSYETTDK